MAFLPLSDREEVTQELICQAATTGQNNQVKQMPTEGAFTRAETTEPPKKKAKADDILSKLLGEEDDASSPNDSAQHTNVCIAEPLPQIGYV